MSKTLARITWKFVSENEINASQEDSIEGKKTVEDAKGRLGLNDNDSEVSL